ncbi:cellulase [Pseudomonas sp. B6002]|uniref:cellulose synthase complex periplasmic endoglucanase BcsZ n=1 Tax=Pseudomonas sp. B6002 TaxID=2726978 RepID=UPI0015A0D551|nr:cellulose synthase complex periplasmic endoglucanase BcsZ [Pseudomonas sp. B6002]NVZ52223.1 cellulase [Pseudomonas sp. B6002]
MMRPAAWVVVGAVMCAGAAQAQTCDAQWPLWQNYATRFVQEDGRVLNSSLNPSESNSEGQSYAMFFALVGNDRARFDKLWTWTKSNMAGNDINRNLFAWLWGKNKDGEWGVIDANSASDADLWIAYSLLEAARIWNVPQYRADAQLVLANVEKTLIVRVPGLGKMLLPGPVGYAYPGGLWRFNPSYQVLAQLRRFNKERPNGGWNEVADSNAKMLVDPHSNPHGFAANWVGYRATSTNAGVFVVDPYSDDLGSYDAIRAYLWAGMTAKSDPLAAPMLKALGGLSRATAASANGLPPEKVHVLTGEVEKNNGYSPLGFSASAMVFFQARGETALAQLQKQKLDDVLGKAMAPSAPDTAQPVYYDYMLSLFGKGFADQKYRFEQDGTVKLFWEGACAATR